MHSYMNYVSKPRWKNGGATAMLTRELNDMGWTSN